MRRLRCVTARARALPDCDPLQGLGLLLDGLRQGEAREEGRRVVRRLLEERLHVEERLLVVERLEAGRDEAEAGGERRLVQGLVAGDAAGAVEPGAWRRRLRRRVPEHHLDNGDVLLVAGDVAVAVVL